MRALEDFKPGDVFRFGPERVEEAEIIDFGRRYDPQFFHIDPDAAAGGPYGGLIASGWHTIAITMGLTVRGLLLDSTCLGSPGIEKLGWLLPVRPGDALSVTATVAEVRPSASRPDRGLVRFRMETFNQHGQKVMEFTGALMFGRRDRAGDRT